MANYPKELTDLLQEYLTDGVITPKERQILNNKAAALDVNPEEFDLYIDAQVQKLQNAAADAAKKQKGQLCPFCQASLPMFADKCPECGGNITPEASREAEELINVLESALVSMKAAGESKKSSFSLNDPSRAMQSLQQMQDIRNILSGKGVSLSGSTNSVHVDYATKKAEVERYVRKAKMYYGNNKTIQFLVGEVETAIAEAEKGIAAAKKKSTMIYVALGVAVVIFIVFAIIMAFVAESKDTVVIM